MPRSINVPRDAAEVVPPLRAVPSNAEAEKRLARLRRVAWFLDRSIPVGRNWRIGLDPIIGLVPGAGDWIGALLSLYVIYEGARLGVGASVLLRMAGNVLVETIVGTVPILGDLFDFAWQANTKNLALIERHYRPDVRGRSLRRIWLALATFALLVATIIGTAAYLVVKALVAIFN